MISLFKPLYYLILKKHHFYETKEQLLAVKDHWFCGIEPKIDTSEFEQDILASGNHGIDDNYFKNQFKREKAEGRHFVKRDLAVL